METIALNALCVFLFIVGILLIFMYFKTGKNIETYLVKNGKRREGIIDSVAEIKAPDGRTLLTPVVRFTVRWGYKDADILTHCNSKGFSPEEYPENLRPGKVVNIVHHPNNFDSFLIDMGSGNYFGQCINDIKLFTCGGMLAIAGVIMFFLLK